MSGSRLDNAPYATNSFKAVFKPSNSAEASVSDNGTPISQTIGKNIYPKINCSDKSEKPNKPPKISSNEFNKDTKAINAIKIAPTLRHMSNPSLVPRVIASIELS